MRTKRRLSFKFWLRNWLKSWLGIDRYTRDNAELKKDLWNLHSRLREIVDRSFIGVDLGFAQHSQIVMLHYSPITNAWKVIADTKYDKGTYQQLIRNLRKIVEEHNGQYVAIDEAGLEKLGSIADIRARLALPQLNLPTGQEMTDGRPY